jgi:integrase
MPEGVTLRGKTWYVVLREPDPARPGKTKKVFHAGTTHGFHDEQSAIAWRDRRRVALAEGRAVSRDRMTLSGFLADWLPAHATVKGLKPSTVASYWQVLARIDAHPVGQMEIQLIRPADVKRMYSDMLSKGSSARTVEYTGTVLRLALKSAALEYRLIQSSPAKDVAIPRPRKAQVRTWSKEEARVLLRVLSGDRYGRMFVMAAATGARRGELMALRWDDIDLDDGWVTFRVNRVRVPGGYSEGTLKNDQAKRVSLDAGTVAVLREHRREQAKDRLRAGERWLDAGYVFCNVNGGPMNPSNLNRYWKAAVEQAGVPYVKPHALRHMHATLLLEAGVPAHVVAERLGHKDVTTTFKVYAHVTQRLSDQAAQAYADWMAD